MSATIQHKRSTTATSVPATGAIAQGELAVNLADKKLYSKDGSDAIFLLAAGDTVASHSANMVYASPDGSPGVGTFRALVAADVPSLAASKITSGTIGTARLGSGTASASTYLRGDQSWANPTSAVSGYASGRLTLSSLDPCPSADQTAKTTVYYLPYAGNRIQLWNYTLGDYEFVTIPDAGWSLSLSGVVASSNYDVFVYNLENGTAALYLSAAWAADTTRSASLMTADGMAFKGTVTDKNFRYIGTIRTTATTGQCEDSKAKRFVWNQYNRIKKTMYAVYNSGTPWTMTSSTSGVIHWQGTNSSTGANARVEWVNGEASAVTGSYAVTLCPTAASCNAYAAISLDQTTGGWVNATGGETTVNISLNFPFMMITRYMDTLPIGHHWLVGLDGLYVASSGTASWWAPAVLMAECMF